MSLVPYSSRDSREIVLRHNDAIVLRDPQTAQLILRGASATPTRASSSPHECPTCGRSYGRNTSPDRNASPSGSRPYISPEYFRMLHAENEAIAKRNPPSSPIRRLVEPAGNDIPPAPLDGVEFVTSTPAPSQGHRIKREAFSPRYFERFFIEERELGRGGKGVVLLVRHVLDDVSLGQFACKRVPVGNDHAWLEKVLIEVQLLQGLSHPNLVSYRHVWLEDVKLSEFSPTVPFAFILQQYCNSGDLLHYVIGPAQVPSSAKEQLKAKLRRRSQGGDAIPPDVRSVRKLAFEDIYSFFKDIASGLAHLHANNFIHRDLKPSNCLLHRDGNELRCLISDFGEVQPEHVMRKSTGSTGTISYCAPEVLKQDQFGNYGNFSTKSDIFSLGMILYFMCFGRLPYKSADSFQEDTEDVDTLRVEISEWSGFQEERRERPELPVPLYSFLKRLLAIDPADRPGANEILEGIQTGKGLSMSARPRTGDSTRMQAIGRIQAIDSPMIPSTPISEREQRRVRSSAHREDAASSHERLESSSDSTPSASPSVQIQADSQRTANLETFKTPLLMAPPTTLLASIYNRLALYEHQVLSWARLNQQSLTLIVKMAIFLLKMWSISRQCLARQSIWYPLVLLAALELASGTRIRWKVSGALMIIHVGVLWVIERWGGGLCEREVLLSWGHF